MKLKNLLEDIFVKLALIGQYCVALIIVTGYIGAYTLGVLMSLTSEDSFDPAQLFYMLFGTFFMLLYGLPLLLVAAAMYAVFLPLFARFRLRLASPVLLIVIVIALLQAIFLSRFLEDHWHVVGIAALAVVITCTAHPITLFFAHIYRTDALHEGKGSLVVESS